MLIRRILFIAVIFIVQRARIGVTSFSLPCQPACITLFSDVCLRLRALNSRVDAHNEARPPLITPDIRNFHNLFHAPGFPSGPRFSPSPARDRRAVRPRLEDKTYSLELSVREAAYIGAH